MNVISGRQSCSAAYLPTEEQNSFFLFALFLLIMSAATSI